jgi:hypothetical protein
LRESFKAAPAPQEVRAAVSFVEVALEAPAEEEGASLEDTLTKLQGNVMANPGDLEARYNLALKNFQLQRFETSIDACLEVRGGGRREGGRERGEEVERRKNKGSRGRKKKPKRKEGRGWKSPG